jgi:hypothetical protein
LSAARLVEQTAAHASAKHMQLSFAHGPLQSEQEPIVEVTWIVDPIFSDGGSAKRSSARRLRVWPRRQFSRLRSCPFDQQIEQGIMQSLLTSLYAAVCFSNFDDLYREPAV